MPKAYYNEINKNCVVWLENLIKEGFIPDGDVDGRSIKDVDPRDLSDYTQLHFFAGLGGWALAARYAGWKDDEPLCSGSAPCQPFSVSGKQKGFDDERHLWPDFRRIIGAVRPPLVVGEQVAKTAGLSWFDTVVTDLEEDGYQARAVCIPACATNAPIIRERLYWVACTDDFVRRADGSRRDDDNGADARREEGSGDTGNGCQTNFWDGAEWFEGADGMRRPVKPGLRRLVDGYPGRRYALDAIGNAIAVPLAAEVLRALM